MIARQSSGNDGMIWLQRIGAFVALFAGGGLLGYWIGLLVKKAVD